jgi:AraC-like DNA-binding protein
MEQKLEFIFFTHRKQSEYIEFHKHECYELVYYITGNGTTELEGKVYNYSPNTFMIVKPNCLHDERHTKGTDVIFIGFKTSIQLPVEDNLYSDNPQHSIYNYLKQMKQEISEQRKNFSLKADFLLGEMLIEFERMFENSNRKNKDFTYIQGFIDEHFNQHINLDTLVELSGYSYHRFRHLFKEKTGFSPTSYIINKRLQNSAHLLTNTDLSILEISQECGFSNESQFSSMFKKYSGKTPSMYRKTNCV